jgi:hypothetical protein
LSAMQVLSQQVLAGFLVAFAGATWRSHQSYRPVPQPFDEREAQHK